MSWSWGNWSNWNNFDNFNNVVLSNPGYVDFTLQEPNSSNGGTISTTENTPVDLSTAVGVASGQSYTEYYYQQQYGIAGYYYTNYGNPPDVYNFQFTAVNSPSPYDDQFYVNLANSNEFYLSGNSVYLTSNNQLFATLYSTPGELNVVIDGAYYQDYSQIADLIHSVYYKNTSSHPPASQQINFTVGSSASTSVDSTITVDVAPNAPVISSLVNTTGAPGSQITNHAQVEVSGTADPGTTVQIFADGGNTPIGVGTTNSGGTFDIVTSALSDGSHSLTATATDPAHVTGAASALFSVTVDADTGEQNALGVTINGGNPIAAAIATAVPFSVAGIEFDDNGTVTFSDGVNPPVVVTITNGQVAPTANLSGLNDGPITVTLHLDNDAAGNSFTDVVTTVTLYAVIVSGGQLTISAGQTSGSTLVLSGAVLDVQSGGTAIGCHGRERWLGGRSRRDGLDGAQRRHRDRVVRRCRQQYHRVERRVARGLLRRSCRPYPDLCRRLGDGVVRRHRPWRPDFGWHPVRLRLGERRHDLCGIAGGRVRRHCQRHDDQRRRRVRRLGWHGHRCADQWRHPV